MKSKSIAKLAHIAWKNAKAAGVLRNGRYRVGRTCGRRTKRALAAALCRQKVRAD